MQWTCKDATAFRKYSIRFVEFEMKEALTTSLQHQVGHFYIHTV